MDMCINMTPSLFGFTMACITVISVIYMIAKAISK